MPQVRSGIHAFWKIIRDNKSQIHVDVFKKLDHTLFGKIIRLVANGELKPDDVHNDADLRTRMVYLWDKANNGFNIAGELFYITPEDVKNIFGVPCKVDLNTKSSRVTKTGSQEFNYVYYPQIRRLTKRAVEEALFQALANQNKTDVTILLIQLLMCTFFFANTSSTMSWTLANLCHDIDGLKTCAWAHIILNQLKRALNNDAAETSGCVPLIMYWLADKTMLCGRIPMRESLSITFGRWRIPDLKEKLLHMTDIQLKEVLQASVKDEVLMEKFKEAQKENLLHLEPVDDMEMPTFDIWRPYVKDELLRREVEAQKNIIDIISSLEDRNSDSHSQETTLVDEEILKRLQQQKETFIAQSRAWWDMVERVKRDKAKTDVKVEHLRAKLEEK